MQPFWAAALAYVRRDAEHLVDPVGRGPTIYFQQMDRARPLRNRVHVDVWVSRRRWLRGDAALAAGGVLVTDEHAPGWWVLADYEGNEVCIATREP